MRQILLRNEAGTSLTDVDLRLELHGPDGPLAEPWERSVTVPIQPGATIAWEDFAGFGPEMARLRGTDEAFPVDYRLVVHRPERPVAQLSAASSVLAHNEWFNSPALYDSLAAFVQPNTEAVAAVLRSAAQVLLDRTGSGSLQGYQAGPERAAKIAGAVYEALRHAGIYYQGLPASFEQTGQKVRTTAAVLDGRLANCVDLSVTYAACLEQAGLRPLIWLTRGHAFAGFHLDEDRLSSTVVTEANLLISMVESGRAVPVELTGIGPGVESADFSAAVETGLTHFAGGGPDVFGVVDVYLAHRSGIRPMPSVDELAAMPVVPTGTAVAGQGSIDLPTGVARRRLRERELAGDEAPPQVDDSPARVQQWKRSLLDLSLRNPLLNLPTRGKGIDLHVPAGALADLDDFVHRGERLHIVPQDDISHIHELAGARRAQDLDVEVLTRELIHDKRLYGAVAEQRYQKALRGLQRDARTMEQETGGNYLYLTLGTLVHPKAAGGEAHAPLFLLPVRIEGGTGRRPFSLVIDGSEVASPNHCLVEWLRVKHRVRISELEQPIRDEHGIDIGKTLTAIRGQLVDNRLNYRIDETASLRLLSFATFQMWRDLTDHWQTFMANPVVGHLVHTTGATFDDPAGDETDPPVDEGELHLPIPADGSQMKAILLAERGHSFVLEGPPGTGKSQTITNLIARAVTGGRSVLFVAEKQAALEVVKRRLGQIGLGSFALDLHGRKQSLNAIRQQLRDALDQSDPGDDTTWTAVETGYRARLAPLTGYPDRIHSANGAGLTAWSAYEAQLVYGDGVTADVPVPFLVVPQALRERVELALRTFPAVGRSARLRWDHPWSLSGRRDLAGLHPEALRQLARDLEDARVALGDRPALAAVIRGLPNPEDVSRFLPAVRMAVQRALPDRGTTVRATDPGWDDAVVAFVASLAQFRREYGPELTTFRPDVFHQADLETWRGEAHQAAKKLFGKRKALEKVLEKLAHCVERGAAVQTDALPQMLDRLVAARDQAGGLHRRLAEIGGLKLPAGWLPTAPDAEQRLHAACEATEVSRVLLRDCPPMWAIIESGVGPAEVDLLERLRSGWQAWRGVLHSGPVELAFWAGAAGWYDAWQREGAGWLTALQADGLLAVQRWGAALAHADVLAEAGLVEFREQLLRGVIDPDLAEEAYRRGAATTALAERLRAGDVEYFDAQLHDNHIGQYETAAGRLRAALPERLPSVLVRRRPFRPNERRGRVADFTAELRRKRGGRSFRELFESYPDIVLALTPCVLVSPASAGHFLAPNAARFDLVVFDEASQIRVAEAIGAMGRGQSVVVVGDSKQMPPTTTMQASHGDEDTPVEGDPVPEDLDSILSEAVESGLPQRWLSWHYRSQDESLIAFSNHFYYENKLSSLPSPGAEADTGLRWRRVDGQFDRGKSRTNAVEAREVVAEISRRLRNPATRDHSIGVVTFNVQQRDLILDLLEDGTDPLIKQRMADDQTEPIFVKNLENVQGDERDAILFSLAFSPSPETGQLPLNFGPLSQTGGERRLNVAITRARRQVVLFASFDPSHIDLARTTAAGTRHLRAYCEMAAAGVERLGDLSSTRHQRRDRIRDEVAAAIRARGHEVVTGHGLSDFTVDIAVRVPGAPRWQVAVILDGPQWSARPTVADRDSAPVLLRDIMGWPEVVRFWLPAWIRERSALLKRVDEAVSRAASAALASAVPAEPAVRASGQVEPAVTAEPPADQGVATTDPVAPMAVAAPMADEAVVREQLVRSMSSVVASGGPVPRPTSEPVAGPTPFVPYVIKQVGQMADLDMIAGNGRIQAAVRAVLREVIATEGPVEQHRLARMTLKSFGFTNTHPERRAAVLALVDRGSLRRHRLGTFAWPSTLDAQTWRGFRQNRNSSDRDFDEIALEEIANAARYALVSVPRRAEEELLRATLDVLGYRRKTEKIDTRLRHGLELGRKTTAFVRDPDGRYRLG
ncbi:DUF4011 domain-containing protein [Asanoa siamensis]|uniref:DUF4011 domain-containing protein n=1 Tax=Asanoa siamensis TaxID=926357 RepID=UPI0019456430|nr:DUF4011 domain-containing protein [Asanoa siamensis]